MSRALTAYERPRRRTARCVAAVAVLVLAAHGLVGCAGNTAPPEQPLPGGLAGSSLDADVALLRSRDFVARSQAAERLVSAGARALPVLGEAGDFAAPGPGVAAESTTRPVVDAILAQLSAAEVEALLASPHPVLRRGAADELGRRGGWTPVPRLIDRLEDGEPQVREAAHAALRRLTKEFPETGYGRGTTASLAERWRTWWRQEGRAKAAGSTTLGTG